MKKTLIALSVAASAVVSGSSMAAVGEWTPGSEGGSFEMSGTLVVTGTSTNPWEVKVANAVSGLTGELKAGETEATIGVLSKHASVLSIRTIAEQAFNGANGITPQIDYGEAVDLDSFDAGLTKLTLDVYNDASQKIGVMKADFFAGAVYSMNDRGYKGAYSLMASEAGQAFYGGVAKSKGGSLGYNSLTSKMMEIDHTALEHFDVQGAPVVDTADTGTFKTPYVTYSGAYTSAIPYGETSIKITLDEPMGSEDVNWHASLPIIVTYA